jgi:hypothetical protein
VTGEIWRAGAVPAAVVGGVLMLVSLTGGWTGVLGALVGTLLAIVALSVPVLVVKATSSASPPAVMAVALAGYMGCVLLLALAWIALAEREWLSAEHLGATLFATTAAWMAGQVRGLRRLRVLAFGSPTTPGSGDADVPSASAAADSDNPHDTPGHGRAARAIED